MNLRFCDEHYVSWAVLLLILSAMNGSIKDLNRYVGASDGVRQEASLPSSQSLFTACFSEKLDGKNVWWTAELDFVYFPGLLRFF